MVVETQELDSLEDQDKVNLVVPVDQEDQVAQEVQDKIQELAWQLAVLQDKTSTILIKCDLSE